ncbi:MAG: hypothetical protein HUU19_06105 [Phycisphaerales bacterium]|nr:hypothetical protein [Phycisphaerales bacterium]
MPITRPASRLAALLLASLAGSAFADVSWPLKPAPDQPLAFATTLALDYAALEALRDLPRIDVNDFVLPDGTTTSAHLVRVDPFAPGAQVVVASGNRQAPLDLSDMVILSGTIDADPDARVFVSFSAAGVHGVILDQSGDAIISSGPLGKDLLPVIYQMKDLPKDAINWIDKPCGLDRLVDKRKPQVTTNADTTVDRAGPCRLADIAVETDWEYTANIFGGNTAASAAYAVTLMAADSEIYQRDVHTRLRVSFLRVWSDANDPYTTTDNYERIFEFQDYWNANMTHIQRHAAHFLAGVLGSTGGVAYYPGLCQAGYDYGLSSYLSGYFPYPLVDHNGQNWDLMVTAHEIGHNFGAPHTHDVGIDGCGNGDCSHASEGTIMSYCHTCSGGMSNIVMNLHNVIINNHILPYLANDAPCNTLDDGVEITGHPGNQSVAPGATAQFSVGAITNGAASYQWLRNGNALSNAGKFSGVDTATLTITDCAMTEAGSYSVVVSAATCGSETSNAATLGVNCPGDFNNDGFINGDDYDAFAELFDVADPGADINHDGFVNGDDYDFFADHFDAGC